MEGSPWTRPESPSEAPTSYLNSTGVAEDAKLDRLKHYLLAQTNDGPEFFTADVFPLPDLRRALNRAAAEINTVLELALSSLIDLARLPAHNIDVREDAFFKARPVDWESITVQNVDKLGRNEVEWLMREARWEISWLKGEHRRLDLHMRNARRLIREGERTEFQYWPAARRELSDVQMAEAYDSVESETEAEKESERQSGSE